MDDLDRIDVEIEDALLQSEDVHGTFEFETPAAYSPPLGMQTRKSTKRVVLPRQGDTNARGRGAQSARRNTRGSRGRGAHFNNDPPISVADPVRTAENFLNAPSKLEFTRQQLDTAVAAAQAEAMKLMYEKMASELIEVMKNQFTEKKIEQHLYGF